MKDNYNFILAIVLSLTVIVAWQFFFVAPKVAKERQAQEASQPAQPGGQPGTAPAPTPGQAPTPSTAPSAGATPAVPGTATPETRTTAIAESPRIAIVTPKIEGSLNLRGARIDDLKLLEFRETVDPTSANIVLLSPSKSANPYYADFGWVTDGTNKVAVPGPDTEWKQSGRGDLTPARSVTLTWDNGAGLTFTRTIGIDNEYMFTVEQSVTNASGAAVTLYPYGLVSRHGTPKTQGIYVLHEGLIGVFKENKLEEIDYDDVEEEIKIRPEKTSSGWIGITDKYWATALIPAQTSAFQPQFSFRQIGELKAYQADFLGDGVALAEGATAATKTLFFAGAKQVAIIDGYENALGIPKFELLIDWGWFHFITKPLFWLIDWFFKLVGNFGLAILGVTVIIKIAFFPLANRSYVSMSRMKKVQPQMTEIRERHGDDKAKQQQALMELYKKEKINPLSGCLPIFIQIPVFFALYKVLFVTIEMRHAPFFGWIQDLAAPDPTSMFNLFGLIPFTPPSLLMVGVWPLAMGITMFIQMRLNPTPPDKTQAMIFTWMPIVFTFMLASFPAGLVIYWAWNNFLSIIQQTVIMRRQGVKPEIWKNTLEAFGLGGDKKTTS